MTDVAPPPIEPPSSKSASIWPQLLVTTTLVIHAAMLGVSAFVHSPAIDEVGHVPAGLVAWKLSRYDVYSVNPPLMRMIAALPLHLFSYNESWDYLQDQVGSRSEWPVGIAFCAFNGDRTFLLFAIARLACIPFSLLGAWTSFRWSRDLAGFRAGFLSLLVWCFSPMAMGFGAVCVPDISAAAVGITLFYSFRNWMHSGNFRDAIYCGIWLGLTCLTKMTWIILAGILPFLWLMDRLINGRWRPWNQLLSIAAIGLFIVNLGYEFQDTLTPLGEYEFVSKALAGTVPGSVNRFRETPLASIPIPLPKQYLNGIDIQKGDFERGYRSFLNGNWKHGGWWYYYAYGTLVKTPIPLLLLTLISLSLFVSDRRFRFPPMEEIQLLFPGILLFVLVSSQTGFAHHLRYVFPSFPFWFIWISRCKLACSQPAFLINALRWSTRILMAWFIATGVYYFPHNMGYFNEFAGGPPNGDRHLLDSNSDWGQDLLFLRNWLNQHPEVTPLHLAYFGLIDPNIAGIHYKLPPSGIFVKSSEGAPPPAEQEDLTKLTANLITGGFDSKVDRTQVDPRVAGGPKPGYFAISAAYVRGSYFAMPDGAGGIWSSDQPHFTYFDRLAPIARAGYSIRIYHLTVDTANQLREELGWPPLETEEIQ